MRDLDDGLAVELRAGKQARFDERVDDLQPVLVECREHKPTTKELTVQVEGGQPVQRREHEIAESAPGESGELLVGATPQRADDTAEAVVVSERDRRAPARAGELVELGQGVREQRERVAAACVGHHPADEPGRESHAGTVGRALDDLCQSRIVERPD